MPSIIFAREATRASRFSVASLIAIDFSNCSLLQIHRVIKQLRLALLLFHHDGNSALPHHRTLGYYFLRGSDLGNMPFRFDPSDPTPSDPMTLQAKKKARIRDSSSTKAVSFSWARGG